MTKSQTLAVRITPIIPYLRRFGRLLTGSQKLGDDYVADLLEYLIVDPRGFSDTSNDRISLYHLFLNIVDLDEKNPLSRRDGAHCSTKRIDEESPASALLHRKAFLLVYVEGFTNDETARLLDVDVDEIEELINLAEEEIAKELSVDVLIIEDEPLIALELKAMVEELGHRVTEIARTRSRAVESALKMRPGLVLSDIQLADGSSGLDAVEEIRTTSDAPVIFVTAYPEKWLTGQRPEPTYMISKPFDKETVRAVISQALLLRTNCTGNLPDGAYLENLAASQNCHASS